MYWKRYKNFMTENKNDNTAIFYTLYYAHIIIQIYNKLLFLQTNCRRCDIKTGNYSIIMCWCLF